jgi:hypothetical protein
MVSGSSRRLVLQPSKLGDGRGHVESARSPVRGKKRATASRIIRLHERCPVPNSQRRDRAGVSIVGGSAGQTGDLADAIDPRSLQAQPTAWSVSGRCARRADDDERGMP